MELLPLTFATGWASGLNAYATVLLLGPILVGAFVVLWFALSHVRKGWLARDASPRTA